MPSFSKVAEYSSKSINIDISYSKNGKIIPHWEDFFLGFTLNNIFSYKKWDNENVERFYPSLSLLISKKFKNTAYFLEIDNLYLNSDNKFEDKIKSFVLKVH